MIHTIRCITQLTGSRARNPGGQTQSCSVLTVSGAPVAGDEVGARIILLGVGLATSLYA